MATIADYRVVTDGIATMVRGGPGQNFFRKKFNMPGNLVSEQKGILMYKVEADNADQLKYVMRLNGKDVQTLTHDEDRFGTIHEVINTNVLRINENDFEVVATGGEGTLKVSDVVVHFQVGV
jgi:hypothetical protein